MNIPVMIQKSWSAAKLYLIGILLLLSACSSMVKTNDTVIDKTHVKANVVTTKYNDYGKVIEKTEIKIDEKTDTKEITKTEVKTNNMNIVFIISGVVFCIISAGVLFWKIKS